MIYCNHCSKVFDGSLIHITKRETKLLEDNGILSFRKKSIQVLKVRFQSLTLHKTSQEIGKFFCSELNFFEIHIKLDHAQIINRINNQKSRTNFNINYLFCTYIMLFLSEF